MRPTPSQNFASPPAPHDAAAVAIRAHDLTVIYPGSRRTPPRTALSAVTCSIPAGKRVALLGPNGSGKSTLLRLLMLAQHATSGTLHALGQDLTKVSSAARRRYLSQIAGLFQSASLDPLLTVRENLLTHAALVGLRGRDAQQRVQELASQLGVSDRLASRVGTLSGGLARRVDLARALLRPPSLLLLDEPTSGLDLAAREAFFAALRHFHTPAMTVLLSTHLMDEAQACDEVLLLRRGSLAAQGPPDALARSAGALVLTAPGLPADLRQRLASLGFASTGAEGSHAQQPARFAMDPSVPHDARSRASAEAAALLASAQAPFTLAPPTLGDAYLTLTGDALDAPAAADSAPHRAPGARDA